MDRSRFDSALDELGRDLKGFYSPVYKGIIFELIGHVSNDDFEEIIKDIYKTCRSSPKFEDFRESYQRFCKANNRLARENISCMWCNGTGLRPYWFSEKKELINFKCLCNPIFKTKNVGVPIYSREKFSHLGNCRPMRFDEMTPE